MEAEPASETSYFFKQMDQVQKRRQCHTPSSNPYKF